MEQQRIETRTLPQAYVLCDRYRIEKVIGEGGFGITYAGIRILDGLRVAIKEYFPAQPEPEAIKEKGLQHFLHEAEILQKNSYLEGMVTVIDTCTANQTAYIVMEFVEGITLAQYVRENGTFGYDELLALMTPIMKSLSQIHRQGVIHRDISPENIQIGLDNRFYLLDFGAARQYAKQDSRNTVILKQGYAPPEQYTGKGKQGPWTDVYALAATMYTALAGEPPQDSVERLQHDDMDAYYARLKGMASWQIRALQKGLALNAAARYQNMESLLLALTVAPAIEDRKTRMVAKQPQAGNASPGIHKRYWVAVGLAVVVLGICIGSILYAATHRRQAGTQEQVPDTTQEQTPEATQVGTQEQTPEATQVGTQEQTSEATQATTQERASDTTQSGTQEQTSEATQRSGDSQANTEKKQTSKKSSSNTGTKKNTKKDKTEDYKVIESPKYDEIGLD